MTTPIERGAEALWSLRIRPSEPAWSDLPHGLREEYLKDSSAVLEAALSDREGLAHWWRTFDGPAYPTGEEVADAFRVWLLSEGGES